MKVLTNFDPESNSVVIKVSTNLLEKYYYNFQGMLKKKFDIQVSKLDNNSAQVLLPGEVVKNSESVGKGMQSVGIERDLVNGVMEVMNKFINIALRKELSVTEFCPLSGYSFDDLKKDLILAIKAKRNLMFVDTYQNYLTECEETRYRFNQYYIPYGTSEWADAITLIETGNIVELKKWIKPLLQVKSWF